MQPDGNFRAVEFLLLRATVRCPHCGHATRVQAVALPSGHEALSEPVDDGPPGWQTVPLPVVLFDLEYLDADAARALAQRDACLRPPAPGESGWSNRCDACAARVEDLDLHAEPGAPFMPQSAADAAGLMLERVRVPVSVAAAGASLDPPWFDDFLRG